VRVLAGSDGSPATRGSVRAINGRTSSVAAGRLAREFRIKQFRSVWEEADMALFAYVTDSCAKMSASVSM
jgi:hypothetical protein